MASSVRGGCSTRASRQSRGSEVSTRTGRNCAGVAPRQLWCGLGVRLMSEGTAIRLFIVRGCESTPRRNGHAIGYPSLRAQWRPTPQLRVPETRLLQAIRRLRACSATAPQRRSYTVAPRSTRSSAKGLQTMEIDRCWPLSLTRSSGRLLRTFASKRHPRSWSIHHGDSPPSPESPPSWSRA